VYENKIKLIERAFKEETIPDKLRRLEYERLDIFNIINSLIIHNYKHKKDVEEQASNEIKRVFKGLFELSRDDKKTSGYLYLTINLGNKSSPIFFNVITSNIATDISDNESSLAITYPIFESKRFNEEINSLVSQIEQNVYTPKDGSFNYLNNIQKNKDERDEVDIYMDYRKRLNNTYLHQKQFYFVPLDKSHFLQNQ
jgi:hypothetical protein